MKLLAFCLAASACASIAGDESPFLKDRALAVEVERNCSQGCIVFSPAEAQSLMDSINQKLQAREFAAFAAGVEAGKESANSLCRNRV